MYFVKFKYSVTYTSSVFKITSFYGIRRFLGMEFRLLNNYFLSFRGLAGPNIGSEMNYNDVFVCVFFSLSRQVAGWCFVMDRDHFVIYTFQFITQRQLYHSMLFSLSTSQHHYINHS